METAKTVDEFECSRVLSPKSFELSAGYLFCWLVCMIAALFVETDSAKMFLISFFGLLAIVFVVLKIIEMTKPVKLVVDDHRLLCASKEIGPQEIDKIILSYGTLVIKRKQGRWSHLSLPLKKPEDFGRLKDRMAAFAQAHNIRFEVGK